MAISYHLAAFLCSAKSINEYVLLIIVSGSDKWSVPVIDN